jgi:hypothetical protein
VVAAEFEVIVSLVGVVLALAVEDADPILRSASNIYFNHFLILNSKYLERE